MRSIDWRNQRRKESCGGFVSLRILWYLALLDQGFYGSCFVLKHGRAINRLVHPSEIQRAINKTISWEDYKSA